MYMFENFLHNLYDAGVMCRLIRATAAVSICSDVLQKLTKPTIRLSGEVFWTGGVVTSCRYCLTNSERSNYLGRKFKQSRLINSSAAAIRFNLAFWPAALAVKKHVEVIEQQRSLTTSERRWPRTRSRTR